MHWDSAPWPQLPGLDMSLHFQGLSPQLCSRLPFSLCFFGNALWSPPGGYSVGLIHSSIAIEPKSLFRDISCFHANELQEATSISPLLPLCLLQPLPPSLPSLFFSFPFFLLSPSFFLFFFSFPSKCFMQYSTLHAWACSQFSHSVMSDSLWPHGL